MAVRSFTGGPLPEDPNDTPNAGSAWSFTWTGLLNGDVGAPLLSAHLPDKCIQFGGTFGAGGTIKFRGCNLATPNADIATDWFDLTDPQGNAISKTASGAEQAEENPRWVAPIVTAGDGTTTLTATLIANGRRR
jgi:hypothetical protein